MAKSTINILGLLRFAYLALLIYFSQVSQYKSIVAAMGAVLLVYLSMKPSTLAYYVVLLLVPSAENLQIVGSTTLPILIIGIQCIKLLYISIKRHSNKVDVRGFSLVFLLILQTTLLLFVEGESVPFSSAVKCLLYFAFILNVYDKYKLKMALFFTNSIRMVGAGIVIATLSVFLHRGLSALYARFSFGEETTINVIGLLSAWVAISYIYLFLMKIANSRLDIIIWIICTCVVFLTRSRTAMMMLAIGLALYAILGLLSKYSYRIMIMFIAFAIVSMGLYIGNDIVNSVVQSALGRFKLEDISNGRYNLWRQTIDAMINNKIYFCLELEIIKI